MDVIRNKKLTIAILTVIFITTRTRVSRYVKFDMHRFEDIDRKKIRFSIFCLYLAIHIFL